jgi:hypothetical protein
MPENDSHVKDGWKSLWRALPDEVYRDWCECERLVASKIGVGLGSKHETPGAWTSVYEKLAQHILLMGPDEWRNF